MANLNVAMILTLVDTASGPLRAFTALVEGLEAVIGRLTPRLQAAVAGINELGNAGAGTANINRLAKSLTGLNTAVAGLPENLAK